MFSAKIENNLVKMNCLPIWSGRRGTILSTTLANIMFVKTHSHDAEGKVVFPDYLFGFQPAGPGGQPLMLRPPSLIPATPVKNKEDPDPAEAAKAEV